MVTEVNRPLPETYAPGFREIAAGILNLGASHPEYPRSLKLEPWRNFIHQVGQEADLMKMPLTYPGYKQSFLVTTRSMAKRLLAADFEDVVIPAGEKRYVSASQGSAIQGKTTLEGWRTVRKELSPAVSPRELRRHEDVVDASVGDSTGKLLTELSEGDVPPSKAFRRLATRTTLGAYLGQDLSTEEADTLVDSFRSFYRAAPLLILGTGRIDRVKRFVEKKLVPYEQTLDTVLTRALNEGSDGLLTQVMSTQAEDQVLETFRGTIAGQGLLATSLEWLTYALAKDETTQSQLRSALGTPNFAPLCTQFMETTADKYPTVTFLLRQTTKPMETTTGEIPEHSLFAIPLFTFPDSETDISTGGSGGTYNLQFSPGLRRCLGRYLSEGIQRSYVTSLLQRTNDVSCSNEPTPKLKQVLIRPDEEFQFKFN